MRNKEKGEVSLIFSLGALILITISTIITSLLSQEKQTITSKAGSCAVITNIQDPGTLSSGQDFTCRATLDAASANSTNLSCGWSKNGGWPQTGGRWVGAGCSGVNCSFGIRMESPVDSSSLYQLVAFDTRQECGPATGRRINLTVTASQSIPTNTPTPIVSAYKSPTPIRTPAPTSVPKTGCANIVYIQDTGVLAAGQDFTCRATLDAASANSTNLSCGWSKNGGWPQTGGRWVGARCSGVNCSVGIRMESPVDSSALYELVAFDTKQECGPATGRRINLTVTAPQSIPTNTPLPTVYVYNSPTPTPTIVPTRTPSPTIGYITPTRTPTPRIGGSIPSPTFTPTRFPTSTSIPSRTPTPTSRYGVSTPTPTYGIRTPTRTPTPTLIRYPTYTYNSPTPTRTPTPTIRSTPKLTSTPTRIPTSTLMPTFTPVPTTAVPNVPNTPIPTAQIPPDGQNNFSNRIYTTAQGVYTQSRMFDRYNEPYYLAEQNKFVDLNVEVCTNQPCTDDNCKVVDKCYYAGSDALYNIGGQECGQGGRGAVCTDFALISYSQAGYPIKRETNLRYAPNLADFFKSEPGFTLYPNGSNIQPIPGDILFMSVSGDRTDHIAVIAEVRDRAVKILQFNARRCYWIGMIKKDDSYYIDPVTFDYGAVKQTIGWGRKVS